MSAPDCLPSETVGRSTQYEFEKQQNLLPEALRDLNNKLVATLDLREVFNRLLESLLPIIPYDGSLAVVRKNDRFDVILVRELSSSNRGDLRIGVNIKEITSKINTTQAPLLVSVTGEGKSTYCSGDVHSLLGVPIIYRQSLLGVFILQSRLPNLYDHKDEDIALTFASQAGVAIENARLFTEISNRNISIKNLLNNAGQGFLSFGKNLLINEEYSLECINIFQKRIEHQSFPELIYPENESQKKFIERLLIRTLSEKEPLKSEVYLSLLPGEVMINNKNISISYKIINSMDNDSRKELMAILTDITDKRFLENQMEQERNMLKKVVKVVANANDFAACVNDYRSFCLSVPPGLLESSPSLHTAVPRIFQNVHTFKGRFGFLGMDKTVNKLHQFESLLLKLTDSAKEGKAVSLASFPAGLEMSGWMDEDLAMLKEILGEQFLNREDIIAVRRAKLIEIEEMMFALPPSPEAKALMDSVKRLRCRPFKDLLKVYPRYVAELAEQLGKPVRPLEIEGGNFPVDMEKYHAFIKSLLHIFKNTLVHGLESAETRTKMGKEELGSIKCNAVVSGSTLLFSIADDGQGIDMGKLRNTALNKGIYDRQTLAGVSDGEILSLIFKDGFSMREDATEFAGRGFGLTVVKSETERLGGTISVKTEAGKGTQFDFALPYEEI